MIPSKSNLSKENCSPISSNCVIWQGPDIECINLCTGDTVSDVTYKLALEICELKENIGVTDVDLTCIVKVCQTTPEPSKTLANIFELLISKVCCLSEIVEGIPTPPDPYIEPTLIYPSCFSLSNDVLSVYTKNLADKICDISFQTNQNTLDIDSLDERVTDLEAQVPTPLPELNSCLTGTDKVLDDLVEYLENEFCDIKDALGEAGDIAIASGQICENLGIQKQLTDSSQNMNSLVGPAGTWIVSPQNLAQSINNLWLTVCDIRAAVRSILDNCCAPTCDAIKIDFYQRWSSDNSEILQLNFRSKSSLPVGFYDCGQPGNPDGINELTFIDATGFEYSYPITFRYIDYPTNTNGVLDSTSNFGWVDIDLGGPGLLLTSPITVKAELCFTNGTNECIQCVQWTINPSKNTCCEIKATDTVTITYKTC
jgi:hypothetical protein